MSPLRTGHEVQAGDEVRGWVLDRSIGSGSFATVWRAHKVTSDGELTAAIKVIYTEELSKKLKQSLECEVSILERISHENIVRLHEVVEVRNRLYLVMEFCEGGDLSEYIRRNKAVTEEAARAFMQQLGAGLEELWNHHFVHRDLKPQNLLLSNSTSAPVVKIADFGFARDLQPQRLADTLCGSPLYMAPEILQFRKYDAKADLWSVGVILYELVVGRTPFNGANHILLLRDIEKNEVSIPSHIASHLSPCCTELIRRLLRRNPVERISFEEFFRHPFLADGDVTQSYNATPAAAAPSSRVPVGSLRTIASGMVMHIDAPVPSGGEQLPFAVEEPEVGRPSTSLTQTIKPLQQGQPSTQNSYFTGLRGAGKALVPMTMKDSLEEEDDYVIVPSSSSGSGARDVLPNDFLRPVIQVPPLPPPLTVPLVVLKDERTEAQHQNQASLLTTLGHLRFTAGLPRHESLKRVAFLLEDLAAARAHQASYGESLAFRLLSLQVLNIALDTSKNGEGATLVDCAASVTNADSREIMAQMKLIADRADQVGSLLKSEESSVFLPDVWELTYRAALAFARAAAVDELLSNYASSLSAYTKAGALLYFLFADGVELPLQPRLQLAPPDLRRLQRYTISVALRHQGCVALLSGSEGPATSSSQLGTRSPCSPRSGNLLEASLSTHPPLRNQVAHR